MAKKLITQAKAHPWRRCPAGEHWLKTHPMQVPPSRKHHDGSIATRHAHCASNPSGKDQLYSGEIQEIAERPFPLHKNPPCSLSLNFKNGSKYDDFIAGWVQYWNEVLKPEPSLDPNIVKALIASEPRFNANH